MTGKKIHQKEMTIRLMDEFSSETPETIIQV